MAQAVPVLTLVLSAASAGYSIYNSERAAKEAERMGEKNARAIEAETEEAARRAAKDAKRSEARARAAAATLGLGGESVDLYLKDLANTNKEQVDWMKKSGKSRADIAREGGQAAATEAHMTSANTLFSGTNSMFSTWYTAYGSKPGATT